MKHTEILALLEPWEKQIKELERVYEAVSRLIGREIESPLWAAVWKMADAYTASVEARIPGAETWLSWWFWENRCGAKGLQAKAPKWKKGKRLRKLSTLARLLAAKG